MQRLKQLARAILPAPVLQLLGANPYQGYVDERSPRHVAGWVRDMGQPGVRVRFEVLLGDRVIAAGVADRPSAILSQLHVGDGQHAFFVMFDQPVSDADCARVTVRAAGSARTLPLAPALRTVFDPASPVARAVLQGEHLQGYVDERSTRHVAGWVRDLHNPSHRVSVEVVLQGADGGRVVATGLANRRSAILEQLRVGDATYAFVIEFPVPVTEAQLDALSVRPSGTTRTLELAPALVRTFDRNSAVLRAIQP